MDSRAQVKNVLPLGHKLIRNSICQTWFCVPFAILVSLTMFLLVVALCACAAVAVATNSTTNEDASITTTTAAEMTTTTTSTSSTTTPTETNPIVAADEKLASGCKDANDQCTSGNRRSQLVALLLSIFVGGLAIDRFYLGHIVTGILKLITCGGCGIWWLIDVILIAVGSLGDIDGCCMTAL